MKAYVKEKAYAHVPQFVRSSFIVSQKKVASLVQEAMSKLNEESPAPLKVSSEDIMELAKEADKQIRDIAPFMSAARKHLQG